MDHQFTILSFHLRRRTGVPQFTCGAACILPQCTYCGAAVGCRASLNYGANRALLCDPLIRQVFIQPTNLSYLSNPQSVEVVKLTPKIYLQQYSTLLYLLGSYCLTQSTIQCIKEDFDELFGSSFD